MTSPRWLSAAMLAALFIAPHASAQPSAQPRLITVTGEGEVRAKPDRATLSAGVVTQGKTAAATLATNSRAMAAVFDTLKRLGIPERAIQTSEISLQPQYPDDARTPPRIAGYQATNNVTVTVDDLGKLGAAIDALASSGANSLGDIGFSFRDAKPLATRARADAVHDATEKAETMARAAAVTLGPIISISEGQASDAVPMRRMAAPVMMSAAPPVAPGEQIVSATVTISWEIR